MARTLQKLRRIYLGRVLVVSVHKLVSTYSSKHTSHYVGKQIQPIHALQNSSAAPEMNHLSELLSLRLETLVFVCKRAINKNKEVPEKVLTLHESSIPMADPWTCSLPTTRFLPDMYRRATRHRNALSKGTLLSKSQRGLDQMHTDLLSTCYHLRCNRDHKLQLSIRTRSTEVVIKRIWF